MLYWGMFTAGFVVGGIITFYLFGDKIENNNESIDKPIERQPSLIRETDENAIFSNLVKVNFSPKSGK